MIRNRRQSLGRRIRPRRKQNPRLIDKSLSRLLALREIPVQKTVEDRRREDAIILCVPNFIDALFQRLWKETSQ